MLCLFLFLLFFFAENLYPRYPFETSGLRSCRLQQKFITFININMRYHVMHKQYSFVYPSYCLFKFVKKYHKQARLKIQVLMMPKSKTVFWVCSLGGRGRLSLSCQSQQCQPITAFCELMYEYAEEGG